MRFDISRLLEDWDYEPGQISVRKFKSKSGVEKIQLRLDLGILQMNAQGRPDGKRPYGHETLLEHFEARLKRFRKEAGHRDDEFSLSNEDCAKMQQEAVQFHHRYICLYQLHEFEGVLRDTERNLRAFEFMRKYGSFGEVEWPFQHLMPQLILLKTRAEAMLAIETGDYKTALQAVDEGLDLLRRFYRDVSRPEPPQPSGEIQSLEGFARELNSQRPLSKKEKLEHELQEAIRREDYERAAELRDRIKSSNPSRSA